MDPGLLSRHPCITRIFVMLYLLGSTCCTETGTNCPCTDIPGVNHTQPGAPGCFNISAKFRYKCKAGFVRKAGTSEVIKCRKNNTWFEPSLVCIVNPLNPPQTTPKTTSTTFPTSPTTLSLESSVSAETELPELTSTILPPQHTPGASLETSALPQTSSNTPSTSQSTSSLSPPTTTHRQLDRTTPPSSSSFNSTSFMPQGTDAVATKDTPSTSPVYSSAPLTPERVHSTSSLSPPTTTHRPRQLDRVTPPSSSSFNSTSFMPQGTDAVATKVIAPVAIGIIVLAVIGGVWILYKRKSRNSLQKKKQ